MGAEDSSHPAMDDCHVSAVEFAAESVDGSISVDNDDDSFCRRWKEEACLVLTFEIYLQ